MLIVDDHFATRETVSRLFALRGWKVRGVSTATEAVQELASRPDCVILDLALPDGRGERVLEAAAAAGMVGRVVVVSGISDAGRLKAVEEHYHPAAVFLKPVEMADLDRVCSKQRDKL
jgi:FixJ family two-component response regulator